MAKRGIKTFYNSHNAAADWEMWAYTKVIEKTSYQAIGTEKESSRTQS